MIYETELTILSALQQYFPHYKPPEAFALGRWPYFKHIHFKILSEYGGNPYFTPHASESAHTYPQNREMVTITHAAGPCYRRSHSRHEQRTKEERFTLAYVLADRTIFWLRNFLKNSASNRCSAAWGPPRISCRKYKSDEEETERKKAKQTWEFRRGSHVCMSEVNPPSPHCWHLSLWHLQLQPLSRQGRRVYVCARVCLMSQRSGYIQNYSHRNQLHMKTLTKAINHISSRTLTMR